MLNGDQLYRLAWLLAICIGLWFVSYSQHKKKQISIQDRMYLPSFMRFFFGKPESDNVYNIGGIGGQLMVFMIGSVYFLLIIGVIEKTKLIDAWGISLLIVFVLFGMLYLVHRFMKP